MRKCIKAKHWSRQVYLSLFPLICLKLLRVLIKLCAQSVFRHKALTVSRDNNRHVIFKNIPFRRNSSERNTLIFREKFYFNRLWLSTDFVLTYVCTSMRNKMEPYVEIVENYRGLVTRLDYNFYRWVLVFCFGKISYFRSPIILNWWSSRIYAFLRSKKYFEVSLRKMCKLCFNHHSNFCT